MVRAYERNLKNLNQKFLHEMNEHHNIDQYLLSWRGFHGNMCKGFHNLQRDGQMVDVTIAAGGKIFKAHKLVSILLLYKFYQEKVTFKTATYLKLNFNLNFLAIT